MRLRRLDLTRYGHFTDSSFELPDGKSDFHIIFGPNEAGKSTALAAIEDLLFGIPAHSPYNFLHDYSSMRIGAALENGSASLEVLRRKGNKDTLLEPDGSLVSGGEGVIRPYLAGADRPFFERMFSLDHVRLQVGGREILEASDDVGQMLFSAGAGITGLRERLGELSGEADELWSARRAKHRKFYVASDTLKEAQKAIREQTFTASNWRELKRAFDETEEAYAQIDTKIRETGTERNRLSRIRRVLQDVRRKQDLDSQVEELEGVIMLPEDSAKVVAESERKDSEATTRITLLQKQLKRAEESLEDLTFDEKIIRQAEDIRQLHERRIEIRREKADLPRREAELGAAEEELRANASELGWTETASAALIERIPLRTKVAVVRSLLNQRGEIKARVTNHTRLLQESLEGHDTLKHQLKVMDDPADVSRLAIVIRTIRGQGDLTGGIRTAKKAFKDTQELVKRRFETLKPGTSDENEVVKLAVPARAQIQEYREREQEWKRRLRETQQQVSSTRQERDAEVAALERTARDEQVVTPEELDNARSHREALWTLVKIKHVLDQPIPKERARGFEDELEDLTGAFEPAMAKADDLADRRFDHAEAAGRIAEIKRKIGELETLLEQAQENENNLVEEGELLKVEWTSLWDTAPFDPLTAEAMLEWIDVRKEVLEAVEKREAADSTLETLGNETCEAKHKLLGELAAIGVDRAALEIEDLDVIIERAVEEQRLREAEVEQKIRLEEDAEGAAKDVALFEGDFKQAKEDLDDWQRKWTAALDALGLADDTASEAVGAQIDLIDQMREITGRIRSLQHDRIDKIKLDVADFEKVVGKLVEDVALDLSGQASENAVLELETRLDKSVRVQGLRERKDEEVEDLITQIAELEDERRELTASISHLKKAAEIETNEALKEAIERSDQQRTLELEKQQIIDKLQHDGDGKSLEELEKECESVIIDEVVGRETSIQAELDDLQSQQTGITEERSRAREAFQAVGGDDAAAQAAASKQEALAEMQEIAERYVRVKTSAMLLQWAVDRYRQEKQAPLLKRAGELFRIVTGDSFKSLQVEFDDLDNAYLTGVRPGGYTVPVSGMSTGSADQLYLALRVASIEDYFERAEALPFVADDLFINFDDDRAAAGFRLIGELSQKTQVLFFTHHQHLVDVARKALGDSVNLVNLNEL
jgi:uncharacterized protein YhaN